MKSIITDDWEHCYLCSASGYLEEHHCMHGTANRKQAEKYGLKVPLCPDCHRNSPRAVHKNKTTDLHLKKIAQLEFESKYSYELWMQVFGKNYR